MFVLDTREYMWIGGYDKDSNGTEYWLDDTPVDVDQLQVDQLDSQTHLLLSECNKWHLSDWNPIYRARVLCEI